MAMQFHDGGGASSASTGWGAVPFDKLIAGLTGAATKKRSTPLQTWQKGMQNIRRVEARPVRHFDPLGFRFGS